jgi:hypothetical protein
MQAGGPPAEVDIYVDSEYEQDVFERHLALHAAAGRDDP